MVDGCQQRATKGTVQYFSTLVGKRIAKSPTSTKAFTLLKTFKVNNAQLTARYS